MNKEGITVCPYCGEPMIYTFAFSGSEYYCLMCGYDCGVFGGKIVELTKELKCKKKLYERNSLREFLKNISIGVKEDE